MQTVRTNQTVTIPSGTLRLSKDQAARRAASLTPAKGKDVYEVLYPVQFKAGETFGIEPLPKSLEDSVSTVATKKKDPAPVPTPTGDENSDA